EFITRSEATGRLTAALADASARADTYERGRATMTGLNLVILGRPNAGKSTLLNRLVGSDRAIVTPVPGTTRDIVRETIEIGGLPVTLADTAGLRESADLVEGIGIERAREAARSADLILYLMDATAGATTEDKAELDRFPDALVIWTKADLAAHDGLAISALTDLGIPQLMSRLDELVRSRFVPPEGALVNERQRQAVAECASALRAALDSLTAGVEEQMILVDLYRAANSLGILTGAITRDDILSEIFGKFCIGK
ncbi:MAG TPA: GTPase, partial [Thermoanaerobaculia bacterium]|nr:GTPase [Thermoanaerobaculia bacterium]